MGWMADTVLKQMDAKAWDEEMKIKAFEEQKEIQDRLNDQMMYNKLKSD